MTRIVDFADPLPRRCVRRLADLPDRVVEGDPRHVAEARFESADGRLVAGTWTSTPGRRPAFGGREELCTPLSGRVRLVPEEGEAREFGPGESFLIPEGFRGDWEVLETAVKHDVIR